MEKIVSRKIFGLVLAVASLTTAGCDKSPLDVTGTTSTSLTPSYSQGVGAGTLTFSENFNTHSNKPNVLETTGQAPSYATGAAVFTGSGANGSERGYLRTVATYSATSFLAEVTVTIPGGVEGNGIAFVGFGRGEPNCAFFCEPYTDASIYLRIMPTDFFGPNVEVTSGADGTIESSGPSAGGNGTHKVQISYNAGTHSITFSIAPVTKGKPATPIVFGPYVLGPEYDASTAHIFFGGAGMDSFDDLSVKVSN
jgi:hypothetical protein